MDLVLHVNTSNNNLVFHHNDQVIFKTSATRDGNKKKWELLTPAGVTTATIIKKPSKRFFPGFAEDYDVTFYLPAAEKFTLHKRFRKGRKLGAYFEATCANIPYEIFKHKWLRMSFLKNGQQFAAMLDDNYWIGTRKKVHLLTDDDTNVPLLCCLVMGVYVDETTEDDPATFNLSTGALEPQQQPFNEQWKPKSRL